MKNFQPVRTSRALLRATPVAAAVAAVLASGGIAQAQQAAPAPASAASAADAGSVVTITGIRRGIESAISVKKNADQIVEAISAEDLGKLPDTSIAESISRLPGVAAQRTGGRASQISIRGTPPDFATSLLNGREQASTGDSRSVEFDQYPAELLGGVKIYKTPDGALVGQGLSGTVDMQTVRPLDFSTRQVALSYRRNKLNVGSAGTEGDGDRYAISYVDQFLDRKLGIAIGFARLDEQGGVTSRFDNWGGGTARLNNDPANPELSVPYNGFGVFADQENRKRDGLAATIQYKPNKDFSTTLDYFHSTFDKVKTTTGFQAPLNDSWLGTGFTYDRAGVLTEATVSGTSATAGAFNNVRAVVRNDSEATNDENTAIGWNTQFKIGGFTAIADLSHSKATRSGGVIETTAGTAQASLGTAALDTVRFTSNGVFTPGLNYTDRNIIRLTDVQGWGGGVAQPQAGYSKLPKVDDEINGLRLAVKTDVSWGPLVSIEGGVHASAREKERSFTEGRLVVMGDTTGLGSAAIPGTATTAIPMPGGGTINVASFNSAGSIGSVYRIESKLNADIFNKDWFVEEKVNTFYTKADLDTEMFGANMRGNVGLQLVQTDQSSRAFNVDRRTCTDAVCPAPEFSAGTSYTDVLPSLNLNWDFGNAGIVRMGLARVMARPKVDDMRASRRFDYNATEVRFTGDGGNPELKPFRANQIDLAYEKYFGGSKAYVGAAVFYKDLKSFIVNVTDRNYDFATFLPPGTVIPPGVSLIGSFSQPRNGSGGSIKGVELTANFPLNMVASVLDGFGFFVSHSDTSSSVNIPTSGVATDSVATASIPLPGLSKKVTNYAVYFEKWGFSARVAARKRSDFVGEVADFAGDRRLTYIKGETITDMQIGYEIQSGFLKGLAIRGEVSNADNTPFIRFREGDPSSIANQVENKRDGKFYQVGLNYKF